MFQTARDLISQKRYEEARRILLQIDDPKANVWLARLNATIANSAQQTDQVNYNIGHKPSVESATSLRVQAGTSLSHQDFSHLHASLSPSSLNSNNVRPDRTSDRSMLIANLLMGACFSAFFAALWVLEYLQNTGFGGYYSQTSLWSYVSGAAKGAGLDFTVEPLFVVLTRFFYGFALGWLPISAGFDVISRLSRLLGRR